MERINPARLYALWVGAVLVLAGLIGFLYNGSFAVGDDVPRHAVLGVLDVNAWHNLVHLATGAQDSPPPPRSSPRARTRWDSERSTSSWPPGIYSSATAA